MPTSKRSRAPELRRGQLLDAAESVAIGKGLGSLTVAAVASSAGVAKGTTYLYFSSKDELIDAVRDRYLERFLDAIETDDGALIQIRNKGLRHGPVEVMRRLVAGEDVDPSEYYFRTVPEFIAPDGPYEWLNRSIFICSGARYANSIKLWVWRVT